ncbi:MAG TPA: phenylacetate-CoA oxygenase subunit PaaJ [Chryseolinea sp.]|nr:phenylacetate-CoA oxygenase subunit PaaJ [Chryseolinea sp.]HPM31267.1 phenylacetate-CoA oxygenase subunit PaaJ [Chryseolinea sp.]
MKTLTTDTIYNWLEEVKDPEIPVLSLVDLGIITNVTITKGAVHIEMTPTFVGCPALDIMKEEIAAVLKNKGIEEVSIEVNFRDAWSSDKISTKGKQALKEFGLAPPPSNALFTDLEILEQARCPRCDGDNTEMRTPFGPTLCRSIHFCHDCKEAFEQFKPL